MNSLAIAIIIIFAVFILIGYKRGLFGSVLRLVMLVVSMLLSYFLSPIIANVIIKYTNIDDYFKARAYTVIESTVKEKVENTLQEEIGNYSSDTVDALTDAALKTDPTKIEQIEIINELKLPEFIKTALLDYNHDDVKTSLGVDGFYEYVATYISYMIVNALAFVVSFLLFAVIMAIINIVSAIAIRLPIIGGINRVGGMLIGFFEALLLVWLCFVVVAIAADTGIGKWFFDQIDNSSLLTLIYEKNVFMKAVVSARNIL